MSNSDFFQRGEVAYSLCNYKLAEKQFKEAIAADPGSAEAHSMLSVTAHMLSNTRLALSEAQEAVRLDPDYSYAHYALSRAQAAVGKQGLALKTIREAIRLDPECSFLYAQAASVECDLQKYSSAEKTAEIGLEHNPNDVRCLDMLGGALLAQNKNMQADRVLDLALALAPEDYLAHMRKGAAQLRLGHNIPAFEHYKEALRLRPYMNAARLNAINALKAKNPLYLMLIRIFSNRQAVGIGLMIIFFALSDKAGVSTVVAVYSLLILLLIAANIQVFVLRFDPQGKTLLTKREIVANTVFLSVTVLLVLGGIISALWKWHQLP